MKHRRGLCSILLIFTFLFSSLAVMAKPLPAADGGSKLGATIPGAVTPDDFKDPASGEDDTDCVQAAFDSGETVVFTRDYKVRSVEMRGDTQTINFNGYYLYGITDENGTEADKDAILKITGIYLELYDLKINGQFNTNYRAAIHWFSRPTGAAAPMSAYVNIYGLYIRDILVGIQYGAWLDDEAPYDTAQSENYLSGFRMRGVQNVIISNQPNGFLKISNSTLDCHAREWVLVENNPFVEADSYLIYSKVGQVTVENSELLKVSYATGCGLKGKNIVVNNCVMEMPCTWVYAEGDVTLDGVHGGFMGSAGLSGVPMFVAAPGAAGSLRVQNVRMSRSESLALYAEQQNSEAYIFNDLTEAPQYRVYMQNCDMGEWLPSYIAAPEERERVMVENTVFYWSPTLWEGGETQYAEIDDKLAQIQDGSSAEEIILNSPNGTEYRLTVDDNGQLMINSLSGGENNPGAENPGGDHEDNPGSGGSSGEESSEPEKNENPETGVLSSVTVTVGIVLLSAGALVVLLKCRKENAG